MGRLALLGLLTTSIGVAQAARQGESVALASYDERTSRRAFAACDRDGDDRLDIRETRSALPDVADVDGFQDLDRDRDGFLHWPEFDRRYRRLIAKGARFRFHPVPSALGRTVRRPGSKNVPFLLPADTAESEETRMRESVLLLMRRANTDDEPDTSVVELEGLLRSLQETAPTPAQVLAQFKSLDEDRSGGLSVSELVPMAQAMPKLLELAIAKVKAATTTSASEFHDRLGEIHPSLARWSEAILRAADRDGDGKLSPAELGGR